MPELPTVEYMLQHASREELTGQLLMPAAFINDTEEAIVRLEELIREFHIGGLCFFHSPASAATNFEGKKEIPHNPDSLGTLKGLIRRYQRAARYPLLIAMDAEWGLAMRVENGEAYPYALCLGALPETDPLLYQVGLRMAADCRDAGIHWNLAPVADVNCNPENPVIGYRSFGTTPEGVASRASLFYRGLKDGGILGCAKHFPGHGDTAVDSHLALPRIEKRAAALEATEFVPFRRLAEEGVDAIMTGHLAVPSLDPQGLPASLSPEVIRQSIRQKLGFDGAVISDALNMHAVSKNFPGPGEVAWRAFAAGNDMLCFAEDIPEACQRIGRDGDARQIEASFRRVWQLKTRAREAGHNPVQPAHSPAALRRQLAAKCLTEVRSAGNPAAFLGERPATVILAGRDLSLFRQGVRDHFEAEILEWDPAAGSPGPLPAPGTRKILVALQPPALKPAGNFGISADVLRSLGGLMENHEVWLCHFGNPYALHLWDTDRAAGVLVAYLPMAEFQQQAIAYFRGEAQPPGELPIQLKPAR